MVKSIHQVTLVAEDIQDLGAGVRTFRLRDPDSWRLPPFTAGAHVDVHLPGGGVRQYSLCGDPDDQHSYSLGVLKDEAGRGGSKAMHEDVSVGDTVLVSLPRNHFPLIENAPVVLIAGGIGITPFLSMLPVLQRQQRAAKLIYSVRSQAPFWDDVAAYHGIDVVLHKSDEQGFLDFDAIVAALTPHEHLYCCGPAPMLDAVTQAGAALGERLHTERFGVGTAEDADYVIELAKSGQVIPVSSGQTMLQALRAADVDVPASCEAGICLDCKTRWLEGAPVHRELTMDKSERSEWLTPCVSGCASERIVLDL